MLITDFVQINLRDHLRKSREPAVYQVVIGTAEMLDYIVQIAGAMAFLEGCGIVHNNLCAFVSTNDFRQKHFMGSS